MKKRLLTILLLTSQLAFFGTVRAQICPDTCQIYILNRNIYQQEDSLYFDFLYSVRDIRVNADEKLVLELIVKSEDKEVTLPPVVFVGKRRERLDRRNRILAGNDCNNSVPYHVYRDLQTGRIYTFDYTVGIPFARWMKNAELRLRQIHGSCCADKEFSQILDLNISDD